MHESPEIHFCIFDFARRAQPADESGWACRSDPTLHPAERILDGTSDLFDISVGEHGSQKRHALLIPRIRVTVDDLQGIRGEKLRIVVPAVKLIEEGR